MALVEFSKHSERCWSQPFDDAHVEVGWKVWVPRRRQLAVTANVFGARCVETRRFAPALEILKTAERLCACPEILDRGEMAQLRAFVDDSHAFYYYTRAKAHAALMYATRAMRVHARRRDWPHVAKCHLHSAAILSKLRRRAARESHLRPDFKVSVFECFDTSTSAVLRELDESHRSVEKSAESTSM